MYSTFGDIEKALTVFQNIENPDLVSWNSKLSGFSGKVGKLIEMFIQFYKKKFVKPDDYTFAIIISATRSLPACSYGKPLHGQVIKLGFDSNVYIGSTLVSMYFDNSDTESAQKLQVLIPIKDIVFWTEMITGHARTGYGHHGKVNKALMIFDEIVKRGLIPDEVTYLSMLSACNHSGLIDKAKFLWSSMNENGLIPGSKHYSFFVGLLSRAGLLEEAESMIMKIDEHNRRALPWKKWWRRG
ncbi:hypothetical protein L1887_19616 [Cichorium endivia]|nr:hypothetical protein L1887_19616 [Cichorium endivia]